MDIKKCLIRAAVVGAVLLVGGMLVAFFAYPPRTSEQWASWVQAFGAIVAIFVAFFIAMNERINAQKLANDAIHQARLGYIRACYLLANEATVTHGYILQRLNAHKGMRYRLRTERIESLQSNVQALIAKDLPPDLLRAMLSIDRELSYTLMALRQLATAHEVTPDRVTGAKHRFTVVDKALTDLRNRYELQKWINDVAEPTALDDDVAFDEMEYQ